MESILAQTFRDWELIVCDSHSDDGAWEFFQKFKNDPRIRLYQVPREGLYAGWNECLQRVRGEFVMIATSDDTARPQLVERLLVPFSRFPELSLAVCDFKYIDAEGKPTNFTVDANKREFMGEWLKTPSIRDGKTEFLLQTCFGTTWVTMTSVLFRKSLLAKTGMFRRDRGTRADEEWAMRASLASDIGFVPETLTAWRIHDEQATQHKAEPSSQRHLYEAVCAVVADPDSGIPSSWKQVPGWADLLTRVWRSEYYDSFQLYRSVARDQPARFLRNSIFAMTAEPGLLLSRAFRGFGWSEEFNLDRIESAKQLIRTFNASWPPKPVPEGW